MTAVTLAATALGACGAEDGGKPSTSTVTITDTPPPQSPTSGPVSGDAILIETRITDARLHTGVVLAASVIGESAFCRGGKTSGGSVGAAITSTFRCPDGTLKLRYSPTQFSLVQGAVWEVVRGTGSFEGLRGGGSMVATFDNDDPNIGREIFTGIVSK